MCKKSNAQKVQLVSFVLLLVLFNQPKSAYAWFFNFGDRDRRHEQGRYTEIVVGSDRYYYDAGVFYRGDSGRYVTVEAPVGAIVYTAPSRYERVNIDGTTYFRYRDVYYKPAGRGYQVVRINKSHEHGRNHHQDNDHRNDHRDDRRDKH